MFSVQHNMLLFPHSMFLNSHFVNVGHITVRNKILGLLAKFVSIDYQLKCKNLFGDCTTQIYFYNTWIIFIKLE